MFTQWMEDSVRIRRDSGRGEGQHRAELGIHTFTRQIVDEASADLSLCNVERADIGRSFDHRHLLRRGTQRKCNG